MTNFFLIHFTHLQVLVEHLLCAGAGIRFSFTGPKTTVR